MSTQHRALRLARLLIAMDYDDTRAAATELIRLHARVQELESALIADCMTHEQQAAKEPVAWESTTPVYVKFITQSRYEKFSPKVQAWYKPYKCSSCAASRPEAAPAVDELETLNEWNKRRCDALQAAQRRMRDPERTMVCDILANGRLLEPEGERYTVPQQAAPVVPEGWKLVPVEPTVHQEAAGRDSAERDSTLREACKVYKAMLAAAPQPEAQAHAVLSTDEALLRRMLCVAHCGASAYMDDGEASDSSAHPGIDFLRDSPREIQRKIWERNRATLAAAPQQAAPVVDDETRRDAERIDWLEKTGGFQVERLRHLGDDETIFEITTRNDDSFEGDTLREAIDAAIEAQKGGA